MKHIIRHKFALKPNLFKTVLNQNKEDKTKMILYVYDDETNIVEIKIAEVKGEINEILY